MKAGSLQSFVRRSAAPLMVAAAYAGLLWLGYLGVIPRPSELLTMLRSHAEQSGPWLIFLFALAESTAGLNVYFPGSIAIVGSMAAMTGRPLLAVQAFAAIVAGSLLGQHLSYALGRFAGISGAENLEVQRGSRSWWLLFWTSMWHPGLGSMASLFAGVRRLAYRRYLLYMSICGVTWSAVWGIGLYTTGLSPHVEANFDLIVFVFVGLWLVHNLRKAWRGETA